MSRFSGKSWTVTVVGLDTTGAEVERFVLDHGEDVRDGFGLRDWSVVEFVAADTIAARRLVITARVERGGPDVPVVVSQSPVIPRDEGIDEILALRVPRVQRPAAYAVVRSSRGLLLTELSPRTAVAGQWNLPGGGIEPRESPLEAVHREVGEETGQRIRDVRLVDVLTSRWIGRSSSRGVEDHQAIRLIHEATCPHPTDPIVLEEDSSTSRAVWVSAIGARSLPVVPAFRAIVGEFVGHG